MKNKNILFVVASLLFVIIIMTLSILDIKEDKHSTKIDFDRALSHVAAMTNEPHSIMNNISHEKTLEYLVNYVESLGITNEDTIDKQSYQIQTKFHSNNGGYIEGYLLKNLIVSLPATHNRTGDAIVVMAHYDSVPMGGGASDDIAAIAVMLETIRYYQKLISNGLQTNNDIVFAFVDGEEFGLYGSGIFMDSFVEFDNLPSRMKFAINLESRGTDGTLIMFETSKNNYRTIELFSSINGSVFTSSIAALIYGSMPNGTDFSNLNPYAQGLNFANLGQGENYHTQNDNYENLKHTYMSQTADVVDKLLSKLVTLNLNSLNEASSDAVFYSYFDLTIIYSKTFALALGIISMLILFISIVFQIIKKSINIKKMLKGFIIIFSSLIASALVVFISYYLFSYVAVLFGVIDISSVGKITYSNSYLVIIVLLLAFVTTAFITSIMKKILKLEGETIRKSYTCFIALVSLILSIVLAEVSYIFAVPAICLVSLDLTYTLCKENSILRTIPFDIIIFAITLPIIIPILFLATFALGMTYCFVIAVLFSLISLIFIGNYSDTIKYANILLFLKNRKLSFHKGYATLMILLFAITIFGVTFKQNLSTNLLGKQGTYLLGYDDALLYVNDGDTNYLAIRDLNAYPILKTAVTGLSKEDDIYQKNVNYSFTASNNADITYDNNVINIVKYLDNSFFEIYFEKNNIESITIKIADNDEFTIFATDIISNTVSIRLSNSAKITLNTRNNRYNGTIVIHEYILNCNELLALPDFDKISDIQNAKYNYWKIIRFE